MTSNPLKAVQTHTAKMTAQELCDLGNAKLRGELPHADGEYYPRKDVHWIVRNGQIAIEWK
jgi:hypothetical protein